MCARIAGWSYRFARRSAATASTIGAQWSRAGTSRPITFAASSARRRPRRVRAVGVGRELGRLGGRHGAALELEAERAAVAQRRCVLGVGRDEVALRGDVEDRQARHAGAEERFHPRRADLAVVDGVEVAEHVPDVVHEAGDLELSVVRRELLELVGALERVGEDVDRVAELAERVEHTVTRREPLDDLVDRGGGSGRHAGHGTAELRTVDP